MVLLIVTMPTLAAPIPTAVGELQSNMPIVYVDPQYSYAAIGTLLNVSVRIFNLTNSFYQTDYEWRPGTYLFNYTKYPPGGSRYNYSLGNMYGFRVHFSWDPLALEYVNHVVKTPVEDYPDGVLHGPIITVVQDELNSSAGTYSVSQGSWFYPVAGFNCPNKNATIFVLTFRARPDKEWSPHSLSLEYVKLIPDPSLVEKGIMDTIPLLAFSGVFTSENIARVTDMEAGALVGTQLYTPVILGEDAYVTFAVWNTGTATDVYNLTLYEGATLLKTWMNESLASGDSETYNSTLKTEGLELGLHTLTLKNSIMHKRTPILDSFTTSFILIQAPSLSVTSSTSDIYENETVTLSAIEDVNQDPNTEVQNYTWLLYEPGTEAPNYEYEGERVTHKFAMNGTWRIVLLVEDNWRISYNPSRKATVSYMKEILLDVQRGEKPEEPPAASVLGLEQMVIIAVLASIAVLSVVIYVAKKKRVRL